MLTRVNGATPTSEGEAHPGPTRPAPTALPGGRALLQLPALPALWSTLRTPSLRIQPRKVPRAACRTLRSTTGGRLLIDQARAEQGMGKARKGPTNGRHRPEGAPCAHASRQQSRAESRPWLQRGPAAARGGRPPRGA